MIPLDAIKNFYPDSLKGNAAFLKHILKEYVQLLVLDYLATTRHLRKLTFISPDYCLISGSRDTGKSGSCSNSKRRIKAWPMSA